MSFPHDSLDAYKVALLARKVALAFTETLPPGHGDERRQITKASASVVRNLCEGCGRFKPLEKIQKYEIAAGEVSESVGAVASLADCGLGDMALAIEFEHLQGRVNAMLTGMIHYQRRRLT